MNFKPKELRVNVLTYIFWAFLTTCR